MVDEPKVPKTHPVLRFLAGAACPACLVMALAVFPLGVAWERPQSLLAPLTCLFAAVYLGWVAVAGRAPRWPWERGTTAGESDHGAERGAESGQPRD